MEFGGTGRSSLGWGFDGGWVGWNGVGWGEMGRCGGVGLVG